MNEEGISQAAQPEDEVNTTPPNPTEKDSKLGWSMPDPVFRKTSGYLPQGYENRFPQEDAGADDSNSTAEMPVPEMMPDVEPQPDIPDTTAAMPADGVPAPKKSSAGKIVLAIFGILFALALVVVFIAVIYYLFLTPVPSGPFE